MNKLDMRKAERTKNPLLIYNVTKDRQTDPYWQHIFSDPNLEYRIRKFMESIEAGDIDHIMFAGDEGWPKCTDYLLYYYPCLDPKDRYRITINCYVKDGYNFPRKLIIGLKKIKPSGWLDNMKLPDLNAPVTVYRASRTPPGESIKNETSWTIDKDTAMFFYCRPRVVEKEETYFYQASILPKDIIAYTEERGEYEVIQHRGVFDVKPLDLNMSFEDCKTFLDERKQQKKEKYRKLAAEATDEFHRNYYLHLAGEK